MYCVIYEFKVKPNKILQFEKSWAEFTEAIYRVRGSLGSRLHTTKDPLVYVAYAQWPSREIYEKEIPITNYSSAEATANALMKDSVESSKVVYGLEVHDDHLR